MAPGAVSDGLRTGAEVAGDGPAEVGDRPVADGLRPKLELEDAAMAPPTASRFGDVELEVCRGRGGGDAMALKLPSDEESNGCIQDRLQ